MPLGRNVYPERTTTRANDFLAQEPELDQFLTDLDILPQQRDAVWANIAGMRDLMSGEVAWMKISGATAPSKNSPQPAHRLRPTSRTC